MKISLIALAIGVGLSMCTPLCATGQGTESRSVGSFHLGGSQFRGRDPSQDLGGTYTRRTGGGLTRRPTGYGTGPLTPNYASSGAGAVGGAARQFLYTGRDPVGRPSSYNVRRYGSDPTGLPAFRMPARSRTANYGSGGSGLEVLDAFSQEIQALMASPGLEPINVRPQPDFDLAGQLKVNPGLRRAADELAAGRFTQADETLLAEMAMARRQGEIEWLTALAKAGQGDAVAAVRHLRNCLDNCPGVLDAPRGAADLLGPARTAELIASGRRADGRTPALESQILAAWLALETRQPNVAEDIILNVTATTQPALDVADAIAAQLMGPPTTQPDESAVPASAVSPASPAPSVLPAPAGVSPSPASAAALPTNPAPAQAAPPAAAEIGGAMPLGDWLKSHGPGQGTPPTTPYRVPAPQPSP
ncbi:MAG: hypothetical protein BIFFINMI_00827 [Phycisphaerae bacterium]|nr:hypothetical protein [Phycisphaerae bacterium]